MDENCINRIGIVVPLKSKLVSKNWENTCKNLSYTLSCLKSQSSNCYHAVVVGHEKPDFMTDKYINGAPLYFEQLQEMAPPTLSDNSQSNQILYERDRTAKILKGMLSLSKKYGDVTHWFALDADDLIHKDFVKFLCENLDKDTSLIIKYGYTYSRSHDNLMKENDFDTYCGSSAVLSDCILEFPEFFSEENIKTIVFGSISHVHVFKYLFNEGFECFVPLKRLAIYVKDNGENISDEGRPNSVLFKFKKAFRKLRNKARLSDDIRKNFGI